MESIQSLFDKNEIRFVTKSANTPKKISSERHEVFGKIWERVKDKSGKNYKEGFLAKKLSHVKTDELHYLYQQCESARSFSAMFWYLISVKKLTTK